MRWLVSEPTLNGSSCSLFSDPSLTIFLSSGFCSQVSWQYFHLWQWGMYHQIKSRVRLHPWLCWWIWWGSMWWVNVWNYKFYYCPFKPLFFFFIFLVLLNKKSAGYTATDCSYLKLLTYRACKKNHHLSSLSYPYGCTFLPSLRHTSRHGESGGGWRGCSTRGAAMAGQSEAPWTPHLWSLHHQWTLAGQCGTLLWEVGTDHHFHVGEEFFINVNLII